MSREEEHRQVLEFYHGLRTYIKTESKGKLFGIQLHDQWETLTEEQQDNIISAAFVIAVERINQVAHDAIHNTESGRPNRKRDRRAGGKKQ